MRVIVITDGGGLCPSTTTSIGRGGGFGGATELGALGAEGAGVASPLGSGAGVGARNTTWKRIRAATGAPSRVAGEKRQPSAAPLAADANGSSPASTSAAPTVPSFAIVSRSTTSASPSAPAGYGTSAGDSSRGRTIAECAEGGGRSARASCATAIVASEAIDGASASHPPMRRARRRAVTSRA